VSGHRPLFLEVNALDLVSVVAGEGQDELRVYYPLLFAHGLDLQHPQYAQNVSTPFPTRVNVVRTFMNRT
jgi:hypothetical protein